MNSESPPYGPDSDAANELTGLLREAVERIRRTPPPRERVIAVIERAAAWSVARPMRQSHWQNTRRWALAASVAIIMAVAAFALYRASQRTPEGGNPSVATAITPNGARPADTQPANASPPVVPFGGTQRG